MDLSKALAIFFTKFQAQAANSTPHGLGGELRGIGVLGGEGLNFTNIQDPAGIFVLILSNIIGILTVIGFIWFTLAFFIGAISWLASNGDKARVQKAQEQIRNAIIGLILVIGAIFIIRAIGSLIGLDVTNIYDFINRLKPGP